MKKILLYLIILSVAAACQDYPYGKQPLVGVADVTFSVTMPAPAAAETRAFADTDVENIDILVFDENHKFIERIKIDDIVSAGTKKSFSLKLDYTPNARTFHLIANARNTAGVDRVDFTGLTSGALESNVIPGLKTIVPTDFTVSSAVIPIIMWGRVHLNNVTQSVINVTDAKLLRSTAAIKVVNDVEAGVNFAITDVTVSGASTYGFVAPASYTAQATIPSTVNLPSTPATTPTHYSALTPDLILYVYERKNTAANYLHVIIQADYNGVGGYYKVALADQNGIYLDVVRNHRYIVKIKSVNGAGYGTINEAIEAVPTNLLEYDILDTRDDIFLITADGRNELGVSINHLELKGGYTNGTIEIASLFATRNAGLMVESFPACFTNVEISLAQGDGTRKLTATWSSNLSGTADIVVTDGFLKHTIKVVANNMSASSITDNGNPLVYTYQLAGTANAPWSAWIVQGATNRARLHNLKSAAGFTVNGSWGFPAIESRLYSTAYLHVLKDDNNIAIVQYSRPDGTGALQVGRIIIAR